MSNARNKMLVSVCFVFCLVQTVFAYSGGSGEPNDPYQIGTVADWQQLMDANTDWNKHFILVNDVNLQGVAITPIGNYYYGPLPDVISFTGVFDGNGHIIRNVDINMPKSEYISLFGCIGQGGQVRNLGVEDVNIRGIYSVGGLAGYNRGTVSSCYVTGTVAGDMKIGGLVGWNGRLANQDGRGVITDCYTTCKISGIDRWVGGLVGDNRATILDSYATGDVSGADMVGGLVGRNNFKGNAVIIGCHAAGTVTGRDEVGGLVGENTNVDIPYEEPDPNRNVIISCYSTGEVKGENCIGGLVGLNYINSYNYKNFWCTIADCHTSGAVYGESFIGGLIGASGQDVAITNCFTTGNASGKSVVGGLVGGNGYMVSTHFISLMYSGGGNITNCYSTGEVDGDYSVGGLVGANIDDGTIRDCHATGAVRGGVYNIGGLVGKSWRDIGSNIKRNLISRCYATGTVTGGDHVGGLAGEGYCVSNSYATGSVSGNGSNSYCDVGGLIGVGHDISNSYATGAVSGNGDGGSTVCVGGLMGIGMGITNCYAAGAVSGSGGSGSTVYVGGLVGTGRVIIASFWDVNTSGQTTSAGGTGKTTAQMQDIATFLNAGWDFFGETANGSEDIWTICRNISYPKFVWQNAQPIANAGSDQTVYAYIDGVAEVELDGSGSNDTDDCNGLTYHWTWTIDETTYEANGVNPTIELPVGLHTIELVVNDGLVDSAPDYVDVNVVAPLKAKVNIIPPVVNRSSRVRHIIAIVELPKGIKRTDLGGESLILFPADSEEGIEAFRQFVLPWRCMFRVLAMFDKDELMDIIPANGRAKLQIVGQLNSGQYVFGEDSILVFGRRK